MSSLSRIDKLIAELNEEDEIWRKETEKHFDDQRNKYKAMFERIKQIQGESEKCMNDITKGLDNLVSNQHTIEKALKQTDNLDGLPLSPEQQENAVDLVNKMTKFMNNTELITSTVSSEQLQKDVASYTVNVAKELKECKSDLQTVQALFNRTQLLHSLTTNSTGKQQSQDINKSQIKQLYTITEHE